MFMQVFMSWSVYGGQRTTFGPWLSSATFVSFLRIELSLPWLIGKPSTFWATAWALIVHSFFNTYFVYALHDGYVRWISFSNFLISGWINSCFSFFFKEMWSKVEELDDLIKSQLFNKWRNLNISSPFLCLEFVFESLRSRVEKKLKFIQIENKI